MEPRSRTQQLYEEIKRGMLNCTRQWGKSTVTAKAIHRAYHEAETLTITVSPSARQSSERVRMLKGSARLLGVRVKRDGANEILIARQNGSRIIGLKGNEVTGDSRHNRCGLWTKRRM